MAYDKGYTTRYRRISVACAGGRSPGDLSSCEVSLGKMKAVRLTYGVFTAGNQIKRVCYHRLDIVQWLGGQDGQVLGHVPSKPVYRPCHRKGKERLRQKNRSLQSLTRLAIVPVFLEIAGTYVAGTEAKTIGGFGFEVNPPIVALSFKDLQWRYYAVSHPGILEY